MANPVPGHLRGLGERPGPVQNQPAPPHPGTIHLEASPKWGRLPPVAWLSRPLRGSCRKENTLAEQVEAGATVHLPLDQLEPGDLPLGLAAAPTQPQKSRERGPQTFGRRLARWSTPYVLLPGR